jgi:iron(III) transport system permease protein
MVGGLRLQRPVIVAFAATVLSAAVLPPLLEVGGELWNASSELSLLFSARLWRLWWRSILLSGAVTGLSLLIGVPLGAVFEAARFPCRRFLLAAHVGVVFVPPFLPTLGWFHLFGQEGVLGGTMTRALLFSDVGLIMILAACFAPIVTVMTVLGIAGVKGSMVDAARLVSGPLRTVVQVLIPCAAPAIMLSAIIVFALAFSELGVPMFLRVDVYPAVVFSRLGGMDFSPGEAAVFVLPLVLAAIGLLIAERRFGGTRAIASLGNEPGSREPLFTSRACFLLIGALAAGMSLAPFLALGWHAAKRGGFSEVHRWLGDAVGSGLGASASAAVVVTPLALIIGLELARRARIGVWLDAVAVLAFILPSSILGVGMILAWNHRSTQWLYQTPAILAVGFVARYAAIGIRTFAAVAAQLPTSLDDAARVAGAGYLGRLALVARLAPRGLLAAFSLSLVFAFRDLETAVLYYPPGGETLTVRIFTLEANGPPGVVSALALVHVAITFAAVGIVLIPFRAVRW